MPKLSLLPVHVFFLFPLLIGPVAAQQQRYTCPAFSPQVKQKVINDMINEIKRHPIRGCANRADGQLDVECGLTLNFYLGALGYGESRPFNAPWSVWVSCIPELNSVKFLNDQALAREAETQRQETKNAEQRRQEQQARENDPNHLLTRTYYDYIALKKCFDQRQGYLGVNISDQEMALAKKAAKAIEDTIQKSNPGIDKDLGWKVASSDSEDWMTERDKTELILSRYNNQFQLDQTDRNRCQKILGALETRFKQIAPEANAVKKDF